MRLTRPSIDVRRWRQRATAVRRRALGLAMHGWDRLLEATAGPRARLSPYTRVIGPAAWIVGVLALAALVAGFSLGWTELRCAGFFLCGLLLLSIPFVLGGHQLAAELQMTRSRVVVGERANGRVVVTNTGKHRALPLTIELPVGRSRSAFEVPSLKGGAEHEELFAIPTNRRAVLDLGPVLAVRTDPFGLLRRDHELTEQGLLHVHPRTSRIDSSAAGFIRDLEGMTVRKVSDNDVAFHALREYVPGDDRRFIHWKSTARTGTLMVRQFEETRRAHLLVALSTRLDDYATDEEFELAVSVAGSLGAQSLRDGHELTMLSSVRPLRSTHAILLLDQLAGVDYNPAAPRFSDSMRRLAPEAAGASVAVLIGGSTLESAEIRRARRHLGAGVRTIAIRADVGADVVLRKMADVDAATLGGLDDLAGVIRRLSA